MTCWGLFRQLAPAVVAASLALPAGAQDWATRDVCDIQELAVFPEALSPLPLETLEHQANNIPNGTGRFWQITAPNGAVSYLWGTYHSSNRYILDLPDQVLDQIEAARLVALEIDPTFRTRAEVYKTAQQTGRYRPAGTSFQFADLGLPDQIELWVRDRMDAIGWGASSADYLTLGALAELLLWSPCDDFDGGIIPDQDSYIQTRARIAGVPILGLEPSDRLHRHLNHPDNQGLARAMIAVYGAYLAPVADWKPMASHMALYRQGRVAVSMVADAAFVEQTLGNEGPALYAQLNDYLLIKRNYGFVEAASDALEQGGAFIGVGAYHLPGAEGVVDLLRARGYRVERVPLPGESVE